MGEGKTERANERQERIQTETAVIGRQKERMRERSEKKRERNGKQKGRA